MFGVNVFATLEAYLYERFCALDHIARDETGNLNPPRGRLPGYQYAALTIVNQDGRIFPTSVRYRDGHVASTEGNQHCEAELLGMASAWFAGPHMNQNAEAFLYTAYMPCGHQHANCRQAIIQWLQNHPGVRMYLCYRVPYFDNHANFLADMLNPRHRIQNRLSIGVLEFSEAMPRQARAIRRIQWHNLP